MNLATTTYLAKTLGTANFGINSFSVSFLTYFLIVVNLGYETSLTLEIARRPARMNALVSSAIVVRLVLAAAMLAVLGLILLVIDLSPMAKFVVLINSTVLLSTAFGLTSVYQGLQRMEIVAGRDILASLCGLVGVLLLVHGPSDLPVAAAITAGAILLINALIIWQYMREYGALHLRWPRRFDFTSAFRSMTFFWTTLVITVSYNTHIVLLGLLRSEAEAGLFSACWKLFWFAITVPILTSNLFLPRFARLANQPDEKRRIATLYLETILVFTVPICILGIALAPQILLALFGESYVPASSGLALLLVNALVVAINIGLGTPMTASGRQKDVLRITAIGAAVGVALNLLLIPYLGVEGAALATLTNEVVILLMFAADRPEAALHQTVSVALRCLTAALPAAYLAHLATAWSPLPAFPLAAVMTGGLAGGLAYLALLWPLRINLVRLLGIRMPART